MKEKITYFTLGLLAVLAANAVAQTNILALLVTGTQTGSRAISIENDIPRLGLQENDAAADNEVWYIDANAEQFAMSAVNDALSVVTDFMRVDRTGTTVDTVNFLATDVQINGVNATFDTGTFTVTLATACTTTPNGTATYAQAGDIVSIELPSISCTSNSTLFQTTTDMPASIMPTTNQEALVGITNNGTVGEGCVLISSAGSLNFSTRGDCALSVWTASGTKAMHNTTFTYLLN